MYYANKHPDYFEYNLVEWEIKYVPQINKKKS